MVKSSLKCYHHGHNTTFRRIYARWAEPDFPNPRYGAYSVLLSAVVGFFQGPATSHLIIVGQLTMHRHF